MTLTALAALTVPLTADIKADFDIALGLAGLRTATARFDRGILSFYRQSDGPSPLFDSCYQDPWSMPFFVEMNRKQLTLAFGQPASAIEVASRLLGSGSRRSLLGDPAKSALDKANGASPLADAVGALKKAGLVKAATPSMANVPRDAQRAAAIIVFAALESLEYRRAAFLSVNDLAASYSQSLVSRGEPDGPLAERKQGVLQKQVDMAYMYAAGQNLGAAASAAAAVARLVPDSIAYDFRLETDWGWIVLSGGKATSHEGSANFVTIDTGGDDTYVNNPRTSSVSNWVSVTVDTVGDDKYVSDPALVKTSVADWPLRAKQKQELGPCSAMFGFAILLDEAGDDLYRTSRVGLGSATFGVAYLGDRDGTDTYDAYMDAQGFGHYGVGILDDGDGNDTYRGFNQVQAVGLPHGAGLLLDRAGDDVYEANDKVLDFPSAQSQDHNTSMAQGAGYGFRADYLTGHSQSGGIGILFDLGGKDAYSCGVFGQGVGYWEGTGMLWDGGGDDTYTGQWYVQAASAHFGIGYLEDVGGNDQYTAMMNMAQGAGHDFSVGMLMDRAGDDRYMAPNLSLGAGNANSIGVFADFEGKDSYTSSGITLGLSAEAQKSSLRERALSLGVFLDLDGQDSYPEAFGWAKNSQRSANWNSKNDPPAESQVGVFLDR